MKKLIFPLAAAALLAATPFAFAQMKSNDRPGQSEYAPGQRQKEPGQAKRFAPGQQEQKANKDKKPGAKEYAPGRQPHR